MDVVEVEEIKAAIASRTTKEDRILEILRDNLSSDIFVAVWQDTVCPISWDLFSIVEGVAAICLLFGTEERRDGGFVRGIGRSRRHELVEERGGTEKEERQGTEVEVWVVLQALLVPLVAIFRKTVSVIDATSRLCHHFEECTVEGEVIAITKEIVVASERCIGLKLVVSVETRFLACQSWIVRSMGGSITAY